MIKELEYFLERDKKVSFLLSYLSKFFDLLDFYIVGGYLRDFYFGFKSEDIDIVVDDINKFYLYIKQSYPELKIVKIKNIYRLIFDNFYVDVSEIYSKDIYKDIANRDFTINNLAYDLKKKKLIYLSDSFNDIRFKILRPLSKEVIKSDYIRIIRAFRFLKKYNLRFCCKEVFKWFLEYAKNLKGIEDNRLWQEFSKILYLEDNFISLYLLYRIGFFSLFGIDMDKRNFLLYKSYSSLLPALYSLLILSLDIDRLRFLTKTQKLLIREFRNHLKFFESLMQRYYEDENEIKRRIIFYLVNNKKENNFLYAVKFYYIINKQKIRDDIISYIMFVKKNISNPLITGDDILRYLNLKPSRLIGRILKDLLVIQITKKVKKKEELIKQLYNIYRNYTEVDF